MRPVPIPISRYVSITPILFSTFMIYKGYASFLYSEGVPLGRTGEAHDPQLFLLGLYLHANTCQYHHPAMDRSGFVFGHPNNLRIADPRHPLCRPLRRLADDDCQQGDMRSRPGCRFTVSAYSSVQMVAT